MIIICSIEVVGGYLFTRDITSCVKLWEISGRKLIREFGRFGEENVCVSGVRREKFFGGGESWTEVGGWGGGGGE